MLAENPEDLPQLVVIDGGKGQLAFAYEALAELGLTEKLTVIALAERMEEVYRVGDPYPMFIDRNSPALKLLQHIRDEAHRFGITFHRKLRSKTQIEVSATDARALGIAAPVRESGVLAGSGACKLVGPAGEVELSEGVIVAKRHIHFAPQDGADFGVVDKEVVQVKVVSDERTLIFDDVVCRVHPEYALAMHIDVDEANAAGCVGEVYGEVIKKN